MFRNGRNRNVSVIPRENDLKDIWLTLTVTDSNLRHKTAIRIGSDIRAIAAAVTLAVRALPGMASLALRPARVKAPKEGIKIHCLIGTGKCL